MDYITVTAKNLDDAITEALVQLEVTSDRLDYEVIEKGSNGLLGFGRKQAVIKARRKEEPVVEVKAEKKEEKPVKVEKAAKVEKTEHAEKKEPVKTETKNEFKKEHKKEKDFKKAPKKEVREETELAKVEPATIEACEKFVEDVLNAMNMEEVKVTSTVDEEGALSITMEGKNMGILIGKRGQTLDSLQYIISLVVNKESDSYIRIKVDTENYRERRKATLENLAKNLAYKVKRTRRPVSLEPMNPYERRVIHSVLQNDRYVETHSEGEEPYRKVVITLKKDYRERSPRSGYNREGRYNRENNYNRERGYRRERSYSREEVERPAENNEHNDSNDNV